MPKVSPARCWANPKCCPSALARATACGWKRDFACMAMTSTTRINPAEASLLWSIGKRRKEAKDFPGGEATMAGGFAKKLVGIRPEGRAPAREGAEIADKTGRIIGKVTSGGFGPSLNAPIAMGYVDTASRRARHGGGSDGARQAAAGRDRAHAVRAPQLSPPQ